MIAQPWRDTTLLTLYRPISMLPVLSHFLHKYEAQSHRIAFHEKHGICNEMRQTLELREYCLAIIWLKHSIKFFMQDLHTK